MDLTAVGKRIKAAREHAGFTQEELAAILGMSPTHISVLERGIKPPKLDTLVNIANALNVSADNLLQDVVLRSPAGAVSELAEEMSKLPPHKQAAIANAIRVLTE